MTVYLRRPVARASQCRPLLRLAALLVIVCAGVDAERLPVSTYTTADGLAHNNVTRIVRDSQGFLWFCTREGLSRFDGYAFRTFGVEYGLPPAAVTDVLETSDGHYWAGTESGLVHLASRDRSSSAVLQEVDASGRATRLPLIVPSGEPRSSLITVLRQARDATVWVGTRSGLFRLDTALGRYSLHAVDIGLPHDYPEQRVIADLLEDRHGTLWIGTPEGLYRRWNDGFVARYTIADGLPKQYIADLLEDRDGWLWVATRDGGFFRLRTDSTHAKPVVDRTFSTANGLPYNWVPTLFQSSDGRLWVGTAKGLVELLGDGQRPALRVYTADQGMPLQYITAIGEDLDGSLWVGNSESGVFKLARTGFVRYAAPEGIESIHAIFADSAGSVCFKSMVFTDDGRTVVEGSNIDRPRSRELFSMDRFGCFDGQRFHWFKPRALTLWGWVREGVTLQTRNGEWWIGSEEGVLRYPPTPRFLDLESARPLAVYRTEHGLPAIQTYRLFEDSRGDVWMSTISSPTRGLTLFERRTGQLRDMGNLPGLPSPISDLARSFAEDRAGAVWLAFNTGLARYSKGAMAFFTPADGLPPGAIVDMKVDRSGRVWLASERSGLVRVDNPSSPTPAFVSYTTANGLSSNSLAAIAEDSGGYLYLGGGNGIDRFDPATGHVRHFTQADGLNPGVLKAAFQDRHGFLWFGMSNGLARLQPAIHKAAAPPILISGLRVAGIPFRVSPFGERHIALGDLPPDDHLLELEFVGLGFGPGEVLRYQYKLEGAGTDWSRPTARRAVTFPRLAPGRYTLTVRAVNSEGLVSPSPAVVAFTILPPFWQRWWFISSVVLALGSAVMVAFRYRLARLLEVANMRTHIATDLHDDIGANLTRIALLSEVARRRRQDPQLEAIATISRESVAAMSDIVWAINPAREGLLDLTRRMRQHADEFFALRGIALRFDAPPGGDSFRLAADVRRDVLLIFKEVVNNAARHSRCTAVEIVLRVERGRLLLTVADNGIGFDPHVETDGQGLTSIRRRAARIKADLHIQSTATSGTVVALTVPI